MPNSCSNCNLIMGAIKRQVDKEIVPPGLAISCTKCKALVMVTNSGLGYAGLAVTNQASYESMAKFIREMEEEARK